MTSFTYGNIQIDRLENTSGIFFGRNVQVDFISKQKINEGIASYGMRNTLEANTSIVIDGDFLDNFLD
jgi:hypothetical protein